MMMILFSFLDGRDGQIKITAFYYLCFFFFFTFSRFFSFSSSILLQHAFSYSFSVAILFFGL